MADLGDIGLSAFDFALAFELAGPFSGVPGVVSGTVEVAGVPSRTRVVLLRQGAVVGTTESDDTGAFSFINVAPADYEVMVFGNGAYRSKVFGPITVA